MKKKSPINAVLLILLVLGLQYSGLFDKVLHVFVTNEATHQIESNEKSTLDVVCNYILDYGELPSYYITKKEAYDLGWDPEKGNLWQVAEGSVIGGDYFANREGLLPMVDKRKWFEADINYLGGFRGEDRIVFSSDGLVYITYDHYESFEKWSKE
jgi:hypothetical protein